MVVPDLLFSLVLTLVLSGIAAAIIRKGKPRKGFFWLFLIIFLATWAGGIWGRVSVGLSGLSGLLPFLLAGIFAALIFSLLAPKEPEIHRQTVLNRKETLDMLEAIKKKEETKEIAYITLNTFFLLLVIFLLVLIVGRYVLNTG